MAALTCEICGGKLVGKPGGVFECDSCGMEYSTEWAKAKIQEVRGTVKVEGTVEVTGTVKVEGGASKESLLKRGQMFLEEGDWKSAGEYFDKVLDIDPECAEAYVGKLCAELHAETWAKISEHADTEHIRGNPNYQKAIRFGKGDLRIQLENYLTEAIQNDQVQRRQAKEMVRKLRPFVHGCLAAGDMHTIGLQADGTVVAAGDNTYGQCNLLDWRDIVAVCAGKGYSLGLHADGTVIAAGSNSSGQCNVLNWKNVISVCSGGFHTVGLHSDGTAEAVGKNECRQCNILEWNNLLSVCAGYKHTVGLRSDGKVIAAGNNDYGQCGVLDWQNIMAIAAGANHTIGLRSDGTMIAAGNNDYGQCNVSDWRDIIAIAAGANHTVGLRSDGTVVAVGLRRHVVYKASASGWAVPAGSEDDQRCDVANWRNIVAICAGECHTVGLQSDGTVIAAGRNQCGQCNVSSWRLFHSAEALEEERAAACQRSEGPVHGQAPERD